MTVVVDASIVAAALLHDEVLPEQDNVFALLASGGAITTPLFWHEIRNLCWRAERRGRIADGEASELLRDLRAAAPHAVEDRGDDEILGVARRYQLTAYDAAYVAIAIDQKAPLATLDRQVRDAAAKGGFALWAPS